MLRRTIVLLTPKTHHLLLGLLDYNSETGHFTWLTTRGGLAIEGSRAGSVSGDGYRYLRVMRKTFKEHRLAWFYVNGEWPSIDIDHIDGNKHNNAISNLREATEAQNVANSSVRSDSVSGLRGVRKRSDCNKWQARITENKKRRFLGNFDSAEEAHAAYLQAASKHFGQYLRS